MRPLLAMIKANLKMNVRNRTALFWNLAFPAIFILIFGAVFGRSDVIEFDVAVTGDASAYQTVVTEALQGDDSFTVKTGATDEQLKKLEDGDLDAVVVFGPASGQQAPPVTIYYDQTDGPNAQIVLNVLRQVLLGVGLNMTGAAGAGPGEGAPQITEQALTSLDITFMDFFIPGILAMSIMNAGVIGLSTTFVAYRERGILRRIKVTPFRLSSFIFARVVAQLIVAVAQALILVAMAWLIFDLHLRGNPMLILFVIIIGALTFLAVGFAISGIARNVETAASYANLVTFPMLFLSGVFFSLDSAPAWLQPITKALPLSYLVNALREPMMRGDGIGAIWLDLLILAATFIVAMAFAVRFFRWDAQGTR
jgi:ABC-2 type transport system permease protein